MTRLNGREVQHTGIDDLIFDIPTLISYCSNWTRLVAGDVISTGTPEGVGFARKPPLSVDEAGRCRRGRDRRRRRRAAQPDYRRGMKAILLRRPGGPEALEYVEVPTPVLGEGKVLVKADTIGVSMPEVLVRRGTYAWMPGCRRSPASSSLHSARRRREGLYNPEGRRSARRGAPAPLVPR
jgi:hypothetical protein